MWLMTPHGFFSIVCKSDDRQKETLTVRSRVKSDLEALKNIYPVWGRLRKMPGPTTGAAPRCHAVRSQRRLRKWLRTSTTTTSRMKWPLNRAKLEQRFMARSGAYCIDCGKTNSSSLLTQKACPGKNLTEDYPDRAQLKCIGVEDGWQHKS